MKEIFQFLNETVSFGKLFPTSMLCAIGVVKFHEKRRCSVESCQ